MGVLFTSGLLQGSRFSLLFGLVEGLLEGFFEVNYSGKGVGCSLLSNMQ